MDANIVSLLHFDGANESTTFTDQTGKTWTPSGNAQIYTADKVFGTGSGIFDGTGDYLTSADHADWDFGSGDFALACRFKFLSTPNASGTGVCPRLITRGNVTNTDSAFGWGCYSDKFNFAYYSGGVVNTFSATHSVVINTWYQGVLVRVNGVVYFYLNGVLEGAVDCTKNFATDKAMEIGRAVWAASECFPGLIDELAIFNAAHWNPNFTPEAAAFED